MAITTWAAIFAALGGAASKRDDADLWSGWISGDGPNRKVTVTSVSLEESGLDLEIEDGSSKIELKAAPKDLEHTEVFLNGKPVDGAAMVFEPKPTLGDFTRFAFDFRPVPLNGKNVRFNMRFDTHSGLF